MEVPSRFKQISEWLEENDDYGDMQLHKNDETGIALLRIANPSKRNALTGKIMSKFSKLIGELEIWEKGKALIVYGSRNFFCSGLNLNLVKQIIDREWLSTQMALLMTDNFRRLRNLPLITIALVEGKALGGGAEFVANLDLRIFTEKAQIGFVHKKMGISCAWTGAISLTKLLGPFKAIEILLSSRLVDGEEAYEIGLANYVINSTTDASLTNDGSATVTYHIKQPQPNQSNRTASLKPSEPLNKLETLKQMDALKQFDSLKQQLDAVKPMDTKKSGSFEHLKSQLCDQNKPMTNSPVLSTKLHVLNENQRTNYCKKIFKRLKKKDEEKEDKLTKRCKLDVNNCEKMKVADKTDKLKAGKLEKLKVGKIDKLEKISKLNKADKPQQSSNQSKMFKKMKRILFDAEEKYIIKPDIELSSCSEDEIDKLQASDDSLAEIDATKLIQDGQLKFKVGLSDEDDNTILNLVYNWLSRLTLSLEQSSWKELKQLVREQRSSDSIDLLSHLNSQLFNPKQADKCNRLEGADKWQMLKSINSVANQTVQALI